jgi:two-component system, chemotaxis family, chemotaxis protein CheY
MTFLTNIRDLNVLLVEPSSAQSLFIESQLKNLGVLVITVFKDGASALESMRIRQPDVVISAMHLPDMTGGELVTRMRANELTRHIAFVLISSESNPHYLEPVRQNGSSAILGKPFTLAQLKMALTTALDYLNPNSENFAISNDLDLENIKVLLVDDSRSARGFMRRVLENLGMKHFTEAVNGKEAVEIIKLHYFDLVVTDYNMPEMDGRELTEYIRTQSWQSSVPVLMVSSENNQSRLAAVAQAGVSGVCNKPFEPTVVKRLLEKMLRPD